MAKVNQRPWKLPGQRTKRKAWGFTAQINGKQVRSYKAEWTRDDAQQALAAFHVKVAVATGPRSDATPAQTTEAIPCMTLTEAAERYLATKARKRTLKKDESILEHLKSAFGADTRLVDITASRISEYKAQRLAARSERRKDANGEPTHLSAAAINRPLALLRHLLRLAHEEWEVLPTVPRMRLEKEPQGRVRWLGQYAPDEEQRLMVACKKSRNKKLASIVLVALETGLRKGELLGLTLGPHRSQPWRDPAGGHQVGEAPRGSDAAGCLRNADKPRRAA